MRLIIYDFESTSGRHPQTGS